MTNNGFCQDGASGRAFCPPGYVLVDGTTGCVLAARAQAMCSRTNPVVVMNKDGSGFCGGGALKLDLPVRSPPQSAGPCGPEPLFFGADVETPEHMTWRECNARHAATNPNKGISLTTIAIGVAIAGVAGVAAWVAMTALKG